MSASGTTVIRAKALAFGRRVQCLGLGFTVVGGQG